MLVPFMIRRRPFEDIRVIEIAHVLSGPFASYQLGLLGAEIIRIEQPDAVDPVRGRGPVAELNARGLGLNYLTQGANKRSIALDLKHPESLPLFWKLAETADVLVENFRAGALEALGIGFEAVASRNNQIIYCSLTGFGQSGPLASVRAYDPVIQAMSGMMRPDSSGRPMRSGGPIVDYASGMAAAFAISAALLQRERFGGPQRIDCSMFETALTLIGPAIVAERYGGVRDVEMPHDPGLGCYETKMGFFQAGCYTPDQHRRLWTWLNRPEFASCRSWKALWALANQMRAALAELMLTRTAEEWETDFEALGIPGARVRTMAEAAYLAPNEARDYFAAVAIPGLSDPVPLPRAPFKFDHDGPRVERPPPARGADTDVILTDLGLSRSEIERLRGLGVFGNQVPV